MVRRWFGHVTISVEVCCLPGRRANGSPKTRYEDKVREEMRLLV